MSDVYALADVIRQTGFEIHKYFGNGFLEKVYDEFIVELKASKALSSEHEAQVLHYMKATKKRHVMLLNFGAPKYEVHKYIL